jgi:ribosome-binding protein aMBF1 (putative translation factor)
MEKKERKKREIPEKDLADVGKMVKLARMQSGLSLRDLSENCGVPYFKISEIENGKTGTTIYTLSRIMSCLDKSIRDGFNDLDAFEM